MRIYILSISAKDYLHMCRKFFGSCFFHWHLKNILNPRELNLFFCPYFLKTKLSHAQKKCFFFSFTYALSHAKCIVYAYEQVNGSWAFIVSRILMASVTYHNNTHWKFEVRAIKFCVHYNERKENFWLMVLWLQKKSLFKMNIILCFYCLL